MFGIFERERDEGRPRYGIVYHLGSFNVIWAALHEWVGIARDVWAAPTWRALFGYMFVEPGWSHDASRDTSASLKRRWRERERGTAWTRPEAETETPKRG